jgi:cobalt-zinc-cadmium efflux system membrane fusion protein
MRTVIRAIAWAAIVATLLVGLVLADRVGQRPHEDPPYNEKEAAQEHLLHLASTSQQLIGLSFAKAERRHAHRTIRASCQVQLDANRQTLVKTFVSGLVEKRLCEQGDEVKAGQPLFIMRSNDLALAKGAYLSAKAQFDLAKTVLDRDDLLIKDKIVSQTQYDTDRAAWLTARTAFVNAREQLLIDGLRVEDIEKISYENQSTWIEAVVTSPIDGVVVQLTNAHTRGDLIPSGTDLCQVADLAHVWVIGNAYEKDIAFLHTGSTARLTFVSYPGHVWEGPIQTISEVVNPATRTVDVRVVCENVAPPNDTCPTPERFPLKPGLFGTIEIDAEAYPEAWVWIPQAALLPYFYDGGEKGVFVATDESHFDERRLRIVSQEGADVAVVGSLAVGERVVTQGNIFLTRNEER